MRNYYILLGLSLLLGSCVSSKESKDHGPGFCTIECSTPSIKIDLSNIPAGEVTGSLMQRYEANGAYNHIIDTVRSQPYTVTPDYDYRIQLSTGNNISIGYLHISPTSMYSYCGEECSDALTNITLLYNYKIVPCNWALTGKHEYTVYMK